MNESRLLDIGGKDIIRPSGRLILVFVENHNEDRVLSPDPIIIMHAHRSEDFRVNKSIKMY